MNTSLAAEPHLLQQLVEELPRPAHEGQALRSSCAGRLAHEHQVGVGVARSEHHLRAALVERAAHARREPRGRARQASSRRSSALGALHRPQD